jgi:uncharacterized protein YcgL (UPF0745 family)
MQCYVYRGSRKEGAYLYLRLEDDFSEVPEQLLKSMGKLSLALSFELHAKRKLAQADPATVKADLEKQGYHLQLAPTQASLLKQSANTKMPQA